MGIEPMAGSRSINQIKLIRLPLHHHYTLVLVHYQGFCAQVAPNFTPHKAIFSSTPGKDWGDIGEKLASKPEEGCFRRRTEL
jgi:hypothetical protein